MINDKNLRAQLIRLAHQNPNGIREKILPLLKLASPPNDPKAVAAEKLGEELQEIGADLRAVGKRIEAAEKLAKKAGLKAGSGFYDKSGTLGILADEADKVFDATLKEWEGED